MTAKDLTFQDVWDLVQAYPKESGATYPHSSTLKGRLEKGIGAKGLDKPLGLGSLFLDERQWIVWFLDLEFWTTLGHAKAGEFRHVPEIIRHLETKWIPRLLELRDGDQYQPLTLDELKQIWVRELSGHCEKRNDWFLKGDRKDQPLPEESLLANIEATSDTDSMFLIFMLDRAFYKGVGGDERWEASGRDETKATWIEHERTKWLPVAIDKGVRPELDRKWVLGTSSGDGKQAPDRSLQLKDWSKSAGFGWRAHGGAFDAFLERGERASRYDSLPLGVHQMSLQEILDSDADPESISWIFWGIDSKFWNQHSQVACQDTEPCHLEGVEEAWSQRREHWLERKEQELAKAPALVESRLPSSKIQEPEVVKEQEAVPETASEPVLAEEPEVAVSETAPADQQMTVSSWGMVPKGVLAGYETLLEDLLAGDEMLSEEMKRRIIQVLRNFPES